MTETEKRMHRACFTGHRPEKLTRNEKDIKKDLEKEIRQAVADGLNVFIKGLNKIKIPSWVPGVGGKGLNFDTIDKLAQGGVLKRGQVGLLEGSGAEAVVPLEKNREWIARVVDEFKKQLDLSDLRIKVDLDPTSAAGIYGSAGGRASSQKTTNMTFNQYNTSPKALDRLSIYKETNNLLFAAKVRMSNV